MRVETDAEPFNTDVVMSPSVRPISISFLCLAGLLTCGSMDQKRLPDFSVACTFEPHRSQLRGQSRFRPHLGRPHRIPS